MTKQEADKAIYELQISNAADLARVQAVLDTQADAITQTQYGAVRVTLNNRGFYCAKLIEKGQPFIEGRGRTLAIALHQLADMCRFCEAKEIANRAFGTDAFNQIRVREANAFAEVA